MTLLVALVARSHLVFLFALGLFWIASGRAEPPFSQPNTTTAADSVVTFNEIMYHPAADNSTSEWVELYNQMSVDIELSNWRIEGGIEFRFPMNSVLPANSYVVVAANPALLPAVLGATSVFGPFAGNLSNSGDTLRLRNHNGRLMDELGYLDEDPWPVAADGSGASLAKREKFSASSPAANWRASAQIGGTPGRANFPETEPTGPVIDALLNPGSASRWLVPTDDSLGQSWTLPAFDDTAWASGSAAMGFDAVAPSGAPPVARAYSFDGTVADVSGQGFDGQNIGAQYSSNVPPAVGAGQSLQFDGVANQVQVNDASDPSAYTLAVWVSVDAVRSSSLIVRTDASGPRITWSHQLRINSSGRFEHYTYDGSVRSVAATNVIQPGVWYHVVGTATSGGAMRIYVNGVSSGGSVTVGNLWAGGDRWRFGTDSGGTPNFFRGRLDEVGIWHVALGTDDIARLEAGAPPALLDGFHGLFTTDVQSSLLEINSLVLVRLPFEVPAGASYDRLTLNVRYDDGFVAYLNGAEVGRRNAPQTLAWNSTATKARERIDALQPETIDLSAFASGLEPGRNVLAFQALNSAAGDPDLLLTAEMSARESLPAAGQVDLAFNEVAAANTSSFFVELLNHGTTNIALSGCRIISNTGGQFTFGTQTLSAGGFLTLTISDLGFSVMSGDKLFLLGPGQRLMDGVKVEDRLRARLPSAPIGAWLYPSAPTPAAANRFSLHTEVVINEIMYHYPPLYATNSTRNPSESAEQWIELYNRSASPVDLGGWRLDGGVHFTFPPNTVLGADAYLVVANNATALRAKYPGITVLGDFIGKLSHRPDRIGLWDAQTNPVNEVTYYDDFPWPGRADGGGSSLELRDPRADNSVPEAWAASIEGAKTSWRRYRYVARAINPVYSPSILSFHEFRLGLLGEGEALLDNISVVELPTNAPPRQLLQNPDFTAGTGKWRLVGNHSHSRVEPDPEDPANTVLHLIATGSTTYLENQLETTLKAGGTLVPVVAGRDYEISFDARWLSGSPQLHTELYYNKVTATTILDMPDHCGTPGRRNSTFVANAGPAYSSLEHTPVVPTSRDAIAITVEATDPDGIDGLTLNYAVNGGAWKRVPMSAQGSGSTSYAGTIPAQTSGAVIQFYVEGSDLLGAISSFPAGGTNSRALIKVEQPRLVPGKQTFRIIMTPADANLLQNTFVNLMSDDLLGCTIVHNEREVFYNARIRLHGSMFSRTDASTTGFTVKFPADHLFRGSRGSVVVRRSGMVESFMKHILNQAGGLPANYDDIVYLVSHRADNTGFARVNLANYDDTYVDSQFEHANDGTVFKLEGIRVYQATDDGTPEGRKLPQPVDFVWSYDIKNLGDDPEQYRWSILLESQRARDDYSSIVAMGKAFSLSGAALQEAAAASLDVDEWARYFALQTLLGIADIYGVDNPHNIAFYARPNDGRVAVLQNDWGFAFSLNAGASIYGGQNVYKLLKLPVYRRLYQGHLLDLMNSVYNRAYLTRWAQHYSDVTGESYTGAPGYAASRGASVRSQLAAQIPFEITSNGGSNFTVNTSTVLLEGRGWINVHDIRQPAQTGALPVTWLDDKRWQAVIPLEIGTNNIQLLAYDYRGAQVGQDSITVTTSVADFPQRDYLRITELMYHPPAPGAAEAAAGFADSDDFEFIELLNTAPFDVPLTGVKFTAGVTFDFTAAAVTNLAPAQRVLVVKDKAAFEFRYGVGLPVAGEYAGSLNNGGEFIRLVDSFGVVIQEFTYHDSDNWPTTADGGGSSLEAIAVNGDYNDPANWRASVLTGGSPGRYDVIPPVFVSATYGGGQIRLRFQAASEQTYTVYWCDNLTTGQWTALTTIPAGDSTRIEEVVDDPPLGVAQRFYRLSTP